MTVHVSVSKRTDGIAPFSDHAQRGFSDFPIEELDRAKSTGIGLHLAWHGRWTKRFPFPTPIERARETHMGNGRRLANSIVETQTPSASVRGFSPRTIGHRSHASENPGVWGRAPGNKAINYRDWTTIEEREHSHPGCSRRTNCPHSICHLATPSLVRLCQPSRSGTDVELGYSPRAIRDLTFAGFALSRRAEYP